MPSHAIKSFVMLRKAIGASSTEAGICDYLVSLSILETCKNKGVSFLGFLRSGETDIDGHIAAQSRQEWNRRMARITSSYGKSCSVPVP